MPAVTPVTTPPATVATAGVPDVHGVAPGVPEPVKVVDAPIQALCVPVIVGVGLIVTIAVVEQPLLFV